MKTAKQYYKGIKRLRKRADVLFQTVGLKLEPNCFCREKATVRHHFIGKSLSSGLRHDIKNGISLCFKHHQRFHSVFDPEIYEKMIENKTAEWYSYIKANRRKAIKPSKENYLKAIETLTKLKI